MNVLLLSDLHLEFCDLRCDLKDGEVDVVVLAGDIHTGDRALDWATREFRNSQVIYIPGNHEYYRGEYHEVLAKLREGASERGIHLLERNTVTIDDVSFFGTTLWTDMALFGHDQEGSPSGIKEADLYMNDFRQIRLKEDGGERRFCAADSVELHKESVTWLRDSLRNHNGKSFVITHHSPSFRSVPDRYSQSLLSAAFSSNLDDLVGLADVWAHGHTHDSFDYLVGKCRVVCNPRGYTRPWSTSQENIEFNPRMIVTI
ncbi:metallophosphoesterase [Silvimonas amylolytica]|uniref:Calcineurin-like phosphoesterase domain-containing protein n=1 Tax=Silvimonas amylolytica TaxID=449663 RepID=A0ABQ2PP68_9NEIS|nr:metallophosphoesterase [Silvimonas amylolytica]GGP26812.1 hypothetical protein GCM10010971_26310 [Silvimonas amylolytica]